MHLGSRFAAVVSTVVVAAARATAFISAFPSRFFFHRVARPVSTRRHASLARLLGVVASLGAATLAGAGEAAPGPTFTVANPPDTPLTWGDVLMIELTGELPNGGVDAALWKVWFNSVPLEVQKVFSTTPMAATSGTAARRTYHLVLRRPNLGTNVNSGVQPNDPDVVAAIIRGVARDRFGVNHVAVRLVYDTTTIAAARDPAGKAIRDAIGFRLAHPAVLIACAAVMVVMVLILVWAAFKRSLLRDYNPEEPDFRKRTFSLSRTQLAFWSVLIIGGYCFLYLITGQFIGHLNNTVLILLGISVGTTALAGLVGGTRDAGTQNNSGQPGQNPPAPPPANALSISRQTSQGFLTDLLSDSQGVNLHRLQMFIWTLVFGVVFISQLFGRFAFPIFDQTTFLLLGISSGTYVFFKRAEP